MRIRNVGVFLLGTGHQRELWDVLVHKVKSDGVSSFAFCVSINNTHSDSSFHIIVGDLNVSRDNVLLSVVFHDCSGFSRIHTCWETLRETFRKPQIHSKLSRELKGL